MKNIVETTTGEFAKQMRPTHCGTYAGEYQDEAYEIFQELWDDEINSWDGNKWMDIMFDQNTNKVYAVWAEDMLTCYNAWCFYIELDEDDAPRAFEDMKEKQA